MPTDGRRRRALAAGSGLLLLALLLVLAPWAGRDDRSSQPVRAAPVAGMRFFDPVAPAGVPQDAAARRGVLLDAMRLADHTYCSYLANTRYPHTSRPAGHHPDQLYPNQPVLEAHPMRREGGHGSDSDAGVLLHTSQSRVYLAAGETVTFSLHAQDAAGSALPLVVTGALAQGMTYGASRAAPRVSLAFAAADDGVWSALFAPGQGGLADFHGTIRTEVRYSAGGKTGFVLFDVVHSPALPARWTGGVKEAVGNGALRFLLHLDVQQPGRYVVSGRVDDAAGRPFALASFNEVLGAGEQEVALDVFGKLLHDAAPRLPLTLRDVEGHLLREDADPDRLLLPRLEGRVFESRTVALDGVPDEEWQSEERSRYLTEYAKDRRQARARLQADDPSRPLPAGACPLPAPGNPQ